MAIGMAAQSLVAGAGMTSYRGDVRMSASETQPTILFGLQSHFSFLDVHRIEAHEKGRELSGERALLH